MTAFLYQRSSIAPSSARSAAALARPASRPGSRSVPRSSSPIPAGGVDYLPEPSMALPLPAKFPRIVRNPRVQGGEPVVRGTRVPVRAIVIAWQECRDAAVLLEAYPRLTQSDVAEALD